MRIPVLAGGAAAIPSGAAIRVVVATPLEPLAELAGLRLAHGTGYDLVAVVGSWPELEGLVISARPDVVVVDLALRTADEDVCSRLAEIHPPHKTIGLIPPNRSLDAFVARGQQADLGGMLACDDDLTDGQLSYAIACVAADKPFYGPTVLEVLRKQRRHAIDDKPSVALLTTRELEVARLAAAGVARSQIARRLFVSPTTVKTQLRAVRSKLGITNPWDRSLVRRRLLEEGLLDEADGTEGA